jgi:uncharacterized membrane protein YphA (DoxX/SURF4 family)
MWLMTNRSNAADVASAAEVAGAAASSRSRNIAYWVTTILLGTEGVMGGMLALIRWPAYAQTLGHLGYPAYFMTIIGVWYALAGIALLAPRLPRVKEWAYAGLVINYTGAAASHLSVGDGAGAILAPTLFTGVAIASWSLRPPARRLAGPYL